MLCIQTHMDISLQSKVNERMHYIHLKNRDYSKEHFNLLKYRPFVMQRKQSIVTQYMPIVRGI